MWLGVVRGSDRISTANQVSYRVIVNATDACGTPAYQSAELIIHLLRPASETTPMFTAALYSFTVNKGDSPGHVIGYLHLVTGT